MVFVKMFLEWPDMVQIMSCGIVQEYVLYKIQVDIVLAFVYHSNLYLEQNSVKQ